MRRAAAVALVVLPALSAGLAAEELPAPVGATEARSPRFAPDGEWIAFEARQGRDGDLYRVRVDGSGLELLTGGPDDDRQPAWTPDGAAIVFSRGDGGDEADLWRLEIASGALRRLTSTPGREGWPDLSPDGAVVSFAHELEGRIELLRLELDTGRQTAVDPAGERSLWPRWSPDGLAIAYFSRRATAGESDDVFVHDLATGRTRRITSRPGHDFCPAWSPAGDRLAVAVSRPEGHRAIEIVGLDGRRLATIASGWERATEPDWSPSGDRIVYAGRRDPASSYRLQIVDAPRAPGDPIAGEAPPAPAADAP